jgi:hypothetical protein
MEIVIYNETDIEIVFINVVNETHETPIPSLITISCYLRTTIPNSRIKNTASTRTISIQIAASS